MMIKHYLKVIRTNEIYIWFIGISVVTYRVIYAGGPVQWLL